MNIPGENISPRELRQQHPDAPKDQVQPLVRWLVVGISVGTIAMSLLLSWLASR